MSGLWDWPALAGGADSLGAPLWPSYRRGIWGKVHGESSDYRWIARSPGFAESCPDLAGALRLGAEDTPVTAPLWRRLPDRYLAAWVYPSRARDSAGRLTVVEKQVCEWPVAARLPAAIAALVLLPEVARFDDSDWWERRAQGTWGLVDYALPLTDPRDTPLTLDEQALEKRIADGIGALLAAATPDALRSFYGRLFSGRFPAGLRLETPLVSVALAVLLLPLPRPWADRLSLAGGLAARRIAPHDLIRNWDGFASGSIGRGECGDLEAGCEELAEAAVDTLLQSSPERAPSGISPASRQRPELLLRQRA